MTPEERDAQNVMRVVSGVKGFIRFFEAVRWHRAPMGLITLAAPVAIYVGFAHTRLAALAGLVGLPLMAFWLHLRRAPRPLVTYGGIVTLLSAPWLCWALLRGGP